jgi:hypothetical protein
LPDEIAMTEHAKSEISGGVLTTTLPWLSA